MGYISKKVAAYGQFVLVRLESKTLVSSIHTDGWCPFVPGSRLRVLSLEGI